MSTPINPKDKYLVPANESTAKITVKGSKFISHIFPAESKDQAEQIYATVQKKFYDATHNCFAYRIDENLFRFSDNGEPSGTAGRPILQVLDGASLFEVLCVVTRYFGGTKLGTGGLIRAYSDAAREALKNLKVKEKIRTETIRLKSYYGIENLIFHLLNQMSGKLVDSIYDKEILLTVELPKSNVQPFFEQLTEQSGGKIQRIESDEKAD
ncbi:YigZ family protein [candidate division KSB1 bacterium]|nr:MAG: YigZ family protein [candidate division KSB1 bacterium]